MSFLLTICGIGNSVFSQSNTRIFGRVYDAPSGAPLAAAEVEVENTIFGAVTDDNGLFSIENIPPGTYTVVFYFVGYLTQRRSGIIVSEETALQLEQGLTPEIIPGDSVIVVSDAAEGGLSVEGEKIVLTRREIEKYRALGLTQLLQQVAGVQIESTGGGASDSYIRIHGSRSSQVLVLLDGQRLNNPQTGEVDLNEIPLEQVEKIEVVRQGNAAIFGGSAFDGVISFKTGEAGENFYGMLHSQLGSFETALGGVSGGFTIAGMSLLSSYQQDYSRQNYDYTYQGETLQRENAWYRNRKIFGKLNYPGGRHRVNLLYNLRDGKQGLPSAFFEEMNHFNAVREATTQSAQLNYRWINSANSLLESALAYHSLEQLYNNEQDFSPFTRYKVHQKNDTYEAKLSGQFIPASSLETRLGFHYYEERLDQKSLLSPEASIGQKRRDTAAGYSSFDWLLPSWKPLLAFWQLRGALRYEKYFNQPGDWYPLLGISLSPGALPALNVSAGWAKAIRYPDFNSLFWKGDARAHGNPDLLPERKTLWNASARLQLNRPYLAIFSAYFYRENLNDLIFWHRTVSGAWEPRNEALAEKQGLDLQLEQHLFADVFHLQTAYSYIDAKNKSAEPNRKDKRIVFTPEHTVNVTLWLGLWRLQSLLIYRFVSEREITPANTGNALPPYNLWDYSVSYRQFSGKLQLELGIAVKNITNTQYQLLRGFPMPGRQFQFTATLKFTANSNYSSLSF